MFPFLLIGEPQNENGNMEEEYNRKPLPSLPSLPWPRNRPVDFMMLSRQPDQS
jgi:hypothetical protein